MISLIRSRFSVMLPLQTWQIVPKMPQLGRRHTCISNWKCSPNDGRNRFERGEEIALQPYFLSITITVHCECYHESVASIEDGLEM